MISKVYCRFLSGAIKLDMNFRFSKKSDFSFLDFSFFRAIVPPRSPPQGGGQKPVGSLGIKRTTE
jgi:hypothetical protein